MRPPLSCALGFALALAVSTAHAQGFRFSEQPDEEKAVEFGYRTTWPGAKKITYGQGS